MRSMGDSTLPSTPVPASAGGAEVGEGCWQRTHHLAGRLSVGYPSTIPSETETEPFRRLEGDE
jgi:hypothetical protein